MERQHGCNLLDPESFKTAEIVCCKPSGGNSTEVKPSSVPACIGKTKPRLRRNKRSGPEKLICGKSLVPRTRLLHEGQSSWPSEIRFCLNDCSEEGKQELAKINLTFQSRQSLPLLDIEKFSSWRRLLRVTAWIVRFISNCKRTIIQNSQKTGNKQSNSMAATLESEEISNAEKYWVQSERFLDELTSVRGRGSISRNSPLWRLSAFLDSDGILRVGGRLEMSNLPYDAKHPVILPAKHHISRLVITHIHNQGHHNLGVNFTLAELRQKYWIVNGREEIKQWERECDACKKKTQRSTDHDTLT